MHHTRPPLPDDLVPLTPATFHILLSLMGHERHGYSILRDVETASHGTLRLGATTLYRTIKQLLASHLIEESDERPDPELDDERRRYYQITPFGRQVLSAETQRLARLVAQAEARGIGVQRPAFGGGL